MQRVSRNTAGITVGIQRIIAEIQRNNSGTEGTGSGSTDAEDGRFRVTGIVIHRVVSVNPTALPQAYHRRTTTVSALPQGQAHASAHTTESPESPVRFCFHSCRLPGFYRDLPACRTVWRNEPRERSAGRRVRHAGHATVVLLWPFAMSPDCQQHSAALPIAVDSLTAFSDGSVTGDGSVTAFR